MDLKELRKTFKLLFPEKDKYQFQWCEGADAVYIMCPVRALNGALTWRIYSVAAAVDLGTMNLVIYRGEFQREIYTRLLKIFVITLCTRRESEDYFKGIPLDEVTGDVYGIKPRY